MEDKRPLKNEPILLEITADLSRFIDKLTQNLPKHAKNPRMMNFGGLK